MHRVIVKVIADYDYIYNVIDYDCDYDYLAFWNYDYDCDYLKSITDYDYLAQIKTFPVL